MKLVYIATQKPIHIGDEFQFQHKEMPVETLAVTYIVKPKHGGSTGKVYAAVDGKNGSGGFFPSVYGMEWIGREDQE